MTAHTRVALIMPHEVDPPHSGDRLRSSLLVQEFLEIGVDPTVIEIQWGPSSSLRDGGTQVSVPGRPKSMLAATYWRFLLRTRRLSDFHAAVRGKRIDRDLLRATIAAKPLVVDFQHSYMWRPVPFPSVVTFHNVESDRLCQMGASTRQIATAQRQEEQALRGSNSSVVFSDVDAARLKAACDFDHTRLHVVPIGLPAPKLPSTLPSPVLTTALFVGSFDYLPNLEAGQILMNLWPRLCREAGLRRLLLVGRDAARYFTSGNGVEVYSDVPSTEPYLREADVHVMPLLRGGGIRVKAIEALAARVPIVATAVALEGLMVKPNHHAIVVDSVADLPSAVASVRPVEIRIQLTNAGFDLWNSRYSAQASARRMAEIYAGIQGKDLRTTS